MEKLFAASTFFSDNSAAFVGGIIGFAIGAFILKEKNIRSKALDLILLLASMVLLYFGSR